MPAMVRTIILSVPAALVAAGAMLTAGASGCGGAKPTPSNTVSSETTAPSSTDTGAAATTAATTTPATAQSEAAHKFLVLAAGCWFGGLWSDAEGEEGDLKKAANESRCKEVSRDIWGFDDNTHVEQLRAIDAMAAGDFVAKVDGLAKNDPVDGPRRDNLVKLAT